MGQACGASTSICAQRISLFHIEPMIPANLSLQLFHALWVYREALYGM